MVQIFLNTNLFQLNLISIKSLKTKIKYYFYNFELMIETKEKSNKL